LQSNNKEQKTDAVKIMEALHAILNAWELIYYPRGKSSEKTNMHDFSLMELHIIRNVANNGGQLLLQSIREYLCIPNSTLTSMIKRLIKNNVLTKSRSSEDGRKYVLQLTDFGYEIDEEHYNVDIRIAETFVSRLESKEVLQFLNIVAKAANESFVPIELSKKYKRL
jgi:DNA-binding MarR family transcriptional regulator